MISLIEKDHRRHRLPYIVRIILAGIMMVIIRDTPVAFLMVPAGIYLAISLLWIYLVERRYRLVAGRSWIKLLRDTVDFMFISLFLMITGSMYSFMMLVYLAWTVGSSMSHDRRYGLYTAVISCVSMGSIIGLHYFAGVPVVTIFTGQPLPFSLTQALATLVSLSVSVIIIHKYVYTIYRKMLDERETISERNQTIERDLQAARRFQQQILPTVSPSERIAALYRPMELLGGDFYDFLQFREPDRIGIFVCDVTGHGSRAAFVTSMIKMLLLQAGQEKMDPAGLLAYLNEALPNEIGDSFVTALYCIFDDDFRRMTYASAGHYHPIVVTGSRVTRLSARNAMPLGILKKEEMARLGKSFINHRVDLDAGSRILLYTDGLIEASRSADDELRYFDEAMDAVLGELGAMDCSSFLSALYARLVQFRGGIDFDDDVCVICIEV